MGENKVIKDIHYEIETDLQGIDDNLVIKMKEKEIINYQMEMINKNAKDSYVEMEMYLFNNEAKINYNTTGLKPLAVYLKQNIINKEIFIGILQNICNTLINCDNYFLSVNNFLLDINCIFISEETMKIKMIYLPVDELKNNITDDLKTLIKEMIIEYAILKDSVNDNYVQVILNSIKEEEFNLINFTSMLENIKKEKKHSFIEDNSKQYINLNKRMENQKPVITEKTNNASVDINRQKIQPHSVITENKNRVNNKHIDNTNFSINKPSINAKSQNSSPVEEPYEIKEIYKTSSKIIGILIQAIFIGMVVCTFLFASTMDLMQKCAAVIMFGALDVLICRIIFKKENKIKVKVKVKSNNKPAVNKKSASEKGSSSVNLAKKEIVSSDSYETEVLSGTTPFLQLANNEKVYINRDSFTVGRMAGEADYIINNKAIGRTHAKIVRKDTDYYLQDLNSKNGTFINGVKLSSGEAALLNEDDEIILANVNMKFKLM